MPNGLRHDQHHDSQHHKHDGRNLGRVGQLAFQSVVLILSKECFTAAGQRAQTVVIQHIITRGTIDERIMTALERKDKTQAALMEAVRAQLTGPARTGERVDRR